MEQPVSQESKQAQEQQEHKETGRLAAAMETANFILSLFHFYRHRTTSANLSDYENQARRLLAKALSALSEQELSDLDEYLSFLQNPA